MTVAIPNPYLVPEAWQRVSVGGSVLPGILTAITIGPRKYAFSTQNGIGQTQVTIFTTVEAIAGIRVDLFLRPNNGTAKGDFEELRDDFMPVLKPGWPNVLTGRPKAYPFVHPAASWVGLKRAHLTDLLPPFQQIQGDPSYWYALIFQEDLPKLTVPIGPAEPAKINGPPIPKDANELAIISFAAGLSGQTVPQYIASRQPAAVAAPTATASGSAR